MNMIEKLGIPGGMSVVFSIIFTITMSGSPNRFILSLYSMV